MAKAPSNGARPGPGRRIRTLPKEHPILALAFLKASLTLCAFALAALAFHLIVVSAGS